MNSNHATNQKHPYQQKQWVVFFYIHELLNNSPLFGIECGLPVCYECPQKWPQASNSASFFSSFLFPFQQNPALQPPKQALPPSGTLAWTQMPWWWKKLANYKILNLSEIPECEVDQAPHIVEAEAQVLSKLIVQATQGHRNEHHPHLHQVDINMIFMVAQHIPSRWDPVMMTKGGNMT